MMETKILVSNIIKTKILVSNTIETAVMFLNQWTLNLFFVD